MPSSPTDSPEAYGAAPNSPSILARLSSRCPAFLQERYNVQFVFGTAVTAIEHARPVHRKRPVACGNSDCLQR